MGKLLILAGLFMVMAGLLFTFWQKVPFLGRLPGDISVQKEGFSFFFPLVSSIVISLVLTVVLNIVLRFFNK
ncbi:MAG: DUF2905 domain-containing protein [Dehalococcoidia bacterium]|nr:DUF2905 domain-containing protein [Dehalococcoidia bacterium]